MEKLKDELHNIIINKSNNINNNIKIVSIENFVPTKIIEELNIKILESWLASLEKNKNKYSSNSQARAKASLRSFYKFLNKNKIINNTSIFNLQQSKIIKRLPKPIPFKDIMKIIKIAGEKKDWTGIRDETLLILIYSTGLQLVKLFN